MKNTKTLIITAILIVYLAVLIKAIVFKYPPGVAFSAEANLVPFKTILPYLAGEPTWRIGFQNLVGNIALFIPLGLLLSLIHRSLTWRRMLVIGAASSLLIETIQVALSKGTFDVDDILLNALGAMLGYAIFLGFMYAIKSHQGKDGLYLPS